MAVILAIEHSSRWRYPARVWLIVLASVFAAEAATHMILPHVLPAEPSRLLDAAVDAVVLIAILAPLLWWLLVRPLRAAVRLRANFVADLFASIEVDRRRTAYDLHDGVGQSLTMLVSGLKSLGDGETDSAIARRCTELRQLASSALGDVKRLALGLRPSLLDDLGLVPAIERVVSDLRDNHPVEVVLDLDAIDGQRLPTAIETAIFRIVQEALANIVKHAQASRVEIAIHRLGRNFVVVISDNGVGMSPAALGHQDPGHLGLNGMRQRAELLGGRLRITSVPGGGTQVAVTIPGGDSAS